MLPRQPIYPRPPASPDNIPMSAPMREWFASLLAYQQSLVRTLEENNTKSNTTVNAYDEVGDVLESASTITLARRIHPVSGDTTIGTIKVAEGFSGIAILLALGAWKLAGGNNIARMVEPIVGQAVYLTFNPATEMWYPS